MFSLLRRFYPAAHKILRKQKIEPVLYMVDWFMCLFCRTLPWSVVLRVWDMFLCEGILVIFKVAIVLVGSILTNEKKNCKEMTDTLGLLKRPPQKYTSEKFLLVRVSRLDLDEKDLKREHLIQNNIRKIKRIAEKKRQRAEYEARRGEQSQTRDQTDSGFRESGSDYSNRSRSRKRRENNHIDRDHYDQRSLERDHRPNRADLGSKRNGYAPRPTTTSRTKSSNHQNDPIRPSSSRSRKYQ